MAVTVTDRRTTYDPCDTITNFNLGEQNTTDYVEATASVSYAFNIESGQLYSAAGTVDLSNTLVYVWISTLAGLDTYQNGAITLLLGDGTNQIGFHMAGQDREAFQHPEGPVPWQCLVLDGSQSANVTYTTAYAGSLANLNEAAITQIGAGYITTTKALGGGYNCFIDIIRYGNDGLRVTGGDSGTEGKFSEIIVQDRATTDLKAHGLIRGLTTGVYGIQGPITFGDSTTATTSYFQDTGISLVYEDRNIGNDKYYLNVEGNSGSTNYFVLSDSTISSAGPYVTCNFASGNVDTLTFDNVSFARLGNAITFSNLADATGHSITGCTFDTCGQVDPGTVTFTDNSFLNTTASTTGAILLDSDGSSNWSNLSFSSGGSGHAIYITAAGTYTFDSFSYSGYGADDTTDAVIYNNSGGSVTINVTGGDTPTVRNGSGASTTINQNVNVTVTIKNQAGDNLPGAEVAIFQDNAARTTVLASTPTDENGQVSTTTAASLGDIIIRVRQSTNIATFNTGTGVDGTNNIITTNSNHNFQDGDPVVYSKNSGTEAIGLTEGTTYYVNNLSATTLSLHTTAADAISDTSRVSLTSSGSETHQLDPERYVANSATGTIGSTDFSTQITMVTDSIATG